jgi:hypothetical protein
MFGIGTTYLPSNSPLSNYTGLHFSCASVGNTEYPIA